jgi:hypothetical protein
MSIIEGFWSDHVVDRQGHAGPVHELPKRELALHLSRVWHTTPTGRRIHIEHPDAAVLSRWKLDDLREEHRRFHEGATE